MNGRQFYQNLINEQIIKSHHYEKFLSYITTINHTKL